MPADQITKRVFELIDPIVTEEGCELLDVEIAFDSGQRVLRVYIDKEGGVQLDDCSRVSGAIEDVIEVEGIVAGQYNLEVSSPGIDRPLVKPSHFERVIGRVVQIQTVEKINGRANYKGVLKQVDAAKVLVEIDQQEFQLPLDKIRKAHTVSA